jgi:hypothetical protein
LKWFDLAQQWIATLALAFWLGGEGGCGSLMWRAGAEWRQLSFLRKQLLSSWRFTVVSPQLGRVIVMRHVIGGAVSLTA